ncbi:hypothetical protein BOH78_3473 [Pichia kudriavzevii]|uniref:Uncharacterized protein n=1 Tax=Pichia kudriavzevii TaxID=4909 RepID=A0A099NKJ7_PICKU|nr:hypothetical protein JL09_g6976 [Pichia kudriavzevii]ONH72996.1 hypothetical protein BOH78_3473 [Pichia kudriavzevii]
MSATACEKPMDTKVKIGKNIIKNLTYKKVSGNTL